MRARNWAADDEERAFTGELADRAGSAGEGTGTFVPGVGVKGTPVWGEEEGKEMKGRGEPEDDGTGMRSSRLSDGGGGGMGKGSSRSSADGDELQEGPDVEVLESEAEGLAEVLRDEVRVERFCRSARLGDLVQDGGGSWAPRTERFDYHRNKTKTVGSTLLEVPGELNFLLIFCSCDSGTNTRTG